MSFFNLFGTSEEDSVEKIEHVVEVVALAVSSKGDMDAAKAIAKAAGFEHIEDALEAPGAKLLVKDADFVLDPNDPLQITVKLNDHLAAVVSVEKAFEPFSGSTDFSENLKGRSFFTSLGGGVETLHDTVIEVMLSEGDRGELIKKAGAAFDDFAAFGKALVEGLPKSVLKIEQVIKALVGITGPGSPDSGGAATDQEEQSGEEIARKPVIGKTEDGDDKKKGEGDDETAEDTNPLLEAFKVQKAEHKAEVDNLKVSITNLTSSLKKVAETVNKIAGSTVIVEPDQDDGDSEERSRVVKNDFFAQGDTGMQKLREDWYADDEAADGS